MNQATLERLREMSREPERQPMSRGVQFPTMAAQHIADEQQIMRLRTALAEAVAGIEELQRVFTGDQRDRLKLALNAACDKVTVMPVNVYDQLGLGPPKHDMVVALPVPLWENLLVAIDYLPFPE